jgi:iron complex transport system substrate-binding protein
LQPHGLILKAQFPQRIVCLTEETTEVLYCLGEQDRIVGISGFTVRPLQARKEKCKVAAFTSAKIDKILDLKPDLVLGFSDLQADIAAALIKMGMSVYVFNQRSVQGILDMILTVGALVGAAEKAQQLVQQFSAYLSEVKEKRLPSEKRPLIYFEEWDEPRISGIRWVSELISIAGGRDCFPELGKQASAKDRIIASDQLIIERCPDIIIGSWCGKKFRPDKVCNRSGWEEIPAVQSGHLYEIKSCDILQPGPAALTDGLRQLQQIIHKWSAS